MLAPLQELCQARYAVCRYPHWESRRFCECILLFYREGIAGWRNDSAREIIKDKRRELVHGSVEETWNDLLKKDALFAMVRYCSARLYGQLGAEKQGRIQASAGHRSRI